MKIKELIFFALMVPTTTLFAQKGIGVSYSTRIFPLQHSNNTNNDYLRQKHTDKDEVIVSNAFEHNFSFYYEYRSSKGKNRIHQVGINNYFARLIFERNAASSYGNADVGGASGSNWEHNRSGIYDYNFLGIAYASLKDRKLSDRFSLRLGTELSFNFLIYNRLHHKINEEVETNWSVTYGPNAESYSTTTKTTDENVPNPNQVKFNFKIAFPCYFRYALNNNIIGLGFSLGFSSQSRVLVKNQGFNLFVNPTISYTYLLGD